MKRLSLILMVLMLSLNINAQKDYDKRPTTYNYNRGLEELQKENYKTALEYFDAELAENPKNGWALGWKGWINAQFEQYGEAFEQLNKAIKLLPKKDASFLASMYATKALINLELEDTITAIKDYVQEQGGSFFRQFILVPNGFVGYFLET